MATRTPIPTRILLICAAIGVATGLLSAAAGYLSGPVVAFVPVLYGLVLGSHVLPGVIAQEVLRRPWVGLVTHLIAALVATAFSPQWIGRYLGAAILIGGLQELVAAIGRYRYWEWWRFMISAVVIGGVLALAIGFAADVGRFAPWAQVVYLALFVVGPILWSAAGVAFGRALRRAGVARDVRG